MTTHNVTPFSTPSSFSPSPHHINHSATAAVRIKRDDNDASHGDEITTHYSTPTIATQTRRSVLLQTGTVAAATATTPTLWLPSSSYAASVSPVLLDATDPNRKVDLLCLQDLPPPLPSKSSSNSRSSTTTTVRLFLCRHGQTENNRLRQVQGARVDPPLNENGQQQAINLGLALHNGMHASMTTTMTTATTIVTSPLTRAQQTADLAARQGNNKTTNSSSNIASTTTTLPSLREIDFGPLQDGQPVARVQEQIIQAYTAWSIGNLDYRPPGGGESGREILLRASSALNDLVHMALNNNDNDDSNQRSIVAVSHSAFLRLLLGLLQQEPLIQAATRKLYNGSITVVDVEVNVGEADNALRRPSQRRRATAGSIWLPQELQLLPMSTRCQVVRVNEFRHLPPLTLQ